MWGRDAFILFALICVLLIRESGCEIERVSNSPYPSSESPSSTTIYVLQTSDYSQSELLCLLSLQGNIAKTQPQLYLVNNQGMELWLNQLQTEYGYQLNEELLHQNLSVVLSTFKSQIKVGYLLCNTQPDETTNVALSLCGITNQSIVATPDLQTIMEDLGIPLYMDVRDKSFQWLWSKYGGKFSESIIEYQEPSKSMQALSDYGVFSSALIMNQSNPGIVTAIEIANSLRSCAALVGWGNSEHHLVTWASLTSLMVNAADWAMDLSFLSNLQLPSSPSFFPIQQQPLLSPSPSPPSLNIHISINEDQTINDDRSSDHSRDHNNNSNNNDNDDNSSGNECEVQTVCFVMSDGDNVQWVLNSLAVSEDWWASPQRGEVPITWTISPALADLAPTVLQYFYQTAARNISSGGSDYFIAAPSGTGYIYPDVMNDIEEFANITSAYMLQTDLSVLNVIADIDPRNFDASPFTSQPNIQALFWYLYSNYAGLNGSISWSNGKPIIGARYMLWDGYETPSSLAAKLNSAPKDCSVEGGYSLIVVHVWDQTVGSVVETVNMLNDGVVVVQANEFVDLVKKNLQN